MKRIPALVGWTLFLVAIADWFALREGLLSHDPAVLAILALGVLVGFAVRWLLVAQSLLTGASRSRTALTELMALSGLLVAFAVGMANWALSLQGAVILNEQETVRLHEGKQLQTFEAGPLARLEEMAVDLTLDRIELVAAGSGGYYPRSSVRVSQGSEEAVALTLTPGGSGVVGHLRFFQGAFGFAPRLVVLKKGRAVFDRVVPFLSRREGVSGVVFEGDLTLEAEDLGVTGIVKLDSLDEEMRGHATVELSVRRGGEPLGAGELAPGEFAELGQDYRIGFAGLQRWSEIDIARRNYRLPVSIGLAVFFLGLPLWAVAWWIER